MRPHTHTRPLRRTPRRLVRHSLPLALAAALATPLAANAQALPTGGTVVDGSATITLPGGATMNINQGSQGAIINWGSFSIGAGGTVNIVQPNATSVILNRVIGTPGSLINGSLNANGRVFIVNPNGVLFGAGSQVNVGGLVASTLQISNEDFNAGVASGRFVFNATSPGAGSVDNFGALVANNQGTIALLAGAVQNGATGTIRADGGTVALASSQQVTLDFFGDGLTQVTIGLGTDDGFIVNSGLLQADGGSVQLRTQTDDGQPGGFGGFIEHAGIIRARSLANRNGRVVLDAGAGEVRIGFVSDGATGATIDASGTAAGQTGGVIEITGDSVEIAGNATAVVDCADAGNACTRIDASGHSGGGDITVASAFSTQVIGDNDGGPATDDSVVIRSDALAAGSGGTVTFTNTGEDRGDGPGATTIAGATLITAQGSGTASGGMIDVVNEGGAILVRNDNPDETFAGPVDFIADGASAGGSISLAAGTGLTFDAPLVADLFTLSADATGSGTGGLVRTVAGDLLDLRGIEVSAGGPTGAGAWEIQSGRGLAIVDGLSEFGPPDSVSLVSDDSIGGALSAGTDVDITVPAAGGGVFPQINIAPGVAIDSTATQPVALALNAPGGQIVAGVNPDDSLGTWRIRSSGGPLDFVADALSTVRLAQEFISGNTASNIETNGGSITLISRNSGDLGVGLDSVILRTDGGDIDIAGLSATTAGVTIGSSTLDTRIDQNAANAGGAMRIFGQAEGDAFAGVSTSFSSLLGSTSLIRVEGQVTGADGAFVDGVSLFATDVATTAGNIEIAGTAAGGAGGAGIALQGSESGSGGSLTSTTGDIVLAGGSESGIGVDIGTHLIETTTGDIDITGRSTGDIGLLLRTSGSCVASPLTLSTGAGDISLTGLGSAGVRVDNQVDSLLSITSDSGRIELRGRATGSDAGVSLGEDTQIATGGDVAISGSAVSGAGVSIAANASVAAGAGSVLLRAGNNGSTAALQVDGSVGTAGVANLRAGEVTAAGGVLDRNASTLQIGGGAGEFVSMDSVANIDAPDLVIGHAGHAGAIAIAEALTRAGNVTLQNTGGAGGIALNAAVNLGSATLALVSGGDITQTAAGGITAQSLLALSTGGDVALTAALNDVSGNTLAGGAAGNFGYADVNALTISDVTARGFDAAGQAATTLAESGVAAGDTVFVRNNAGDLTLGADVSGNIVDLVTAGRLQNIANATITAGDRWRVWADTWIGEQRGGLTGSGPLPNLFNCSFGGPCGVTVPAADDHFIYRQQPIATISIGDATREYGLDNPAFTFGVGGLVFADDLAANVIAGAPGTLATILSNVGEYTITGSFTSPAGYAIQLNPGALAITPATLTYVADPFTHFFGQPLGPFTGIVAGFRNGDTVAGDTTGTLQFLADAVPGSPAGVYPIFGTGLEALNYTFVQDPANLTALRINLAPIATAFDLVREPTDTYLYDRNFGTAQICLATDLLGDRREQDGDALAREWSKVRSRPNLTSCVRTDRKNGCGDF